MASFPAFARNVSSSTSLRLALHVLLALLAISSPLPALAAGLPAGWTWRNPLPTGEGISGVTWTGTQVVAVGNAGLVITSPDGVAWTFRPIGVADWLSAVVWTGTQHVAVGQCESCTEKGRAAVFTSPDAVTWTRRDPGRGGGLYAVAWTGTQLVAAGEEGTILTSPDGISWTARSSGVSVHFEVALAVPASGGRAGLVVVAGMQGTILTSPDGVTWTRHGTVRKGAFLRGGAVVGSRILLVGEDMGIEPTRGVVVASEDGTVFLEETPREANHPLRSPAWNGSRIVVVGESKKQSNIPGEAIVLTSEDGRAWTPRESGVPFVLSGLAWTGKRFVAVGWSGALAYSPDGITWTRAGTGPTPDNKAFADGGAQGLVAVGRGGSIATSPDGSAWTVRTSGTEKGLASVAWTGRTFVAAGNGGTVLLSNDGVAWRTVDPGVTVDLNAVLWTGRGLVAAGTEGTLVASADGERWRKVASPTGRTLRGLAQRAGLLVAVGGDSEGGVVLSSEDGGETWTDRTPNGFPIFSAVASSGSRFVAVGGGGGGGAQGFAASSPDGVDWSGKARGVSDVDLAAVAWDGAGFVAVGPSGMMFASPDGAGWSAEPFFTAANLLAVGLGGGRLLAVGEDGAVLERTGGRAYKYWVPVATHSPGAYGSAWRTDLGLLNPPSAAGGEAGTATAVVTFHSEAGTVSRTQSVEAGRQVLLADVAASLAGAKAGSGALEIDASRPLVVASRTYTTVPADAACLAGATVGEILPAVEPGRGHGAGESAWLAQLAETNDYRTNVALVNTGAFPATVSLSLRDGTGRELALLGVSLGAGAWWQAYRPFQPYAGSGLPAASVRLEVTSGQGVHSYASVVDNRTNDPVTVRPVASAGGPVVHSWLPVAVHAGGAEGSAWRTDLGLLNTGTVAADVELTWRGAGRTTRSTARVAPGQQAVLPDVVGQIPAEGAGSLEIVSNRPIVATSRVFSQRPADASCLAGGTAGRFFAASPSGKGLGAGETAWLPMLREDGTFRTNLELTNTGEAPSVVLVELFDGDGHILAAFPVPVAPGEYRQEHRPFLVRAGRADVASGWASATVLSGGGLLVSSSVIDDRSNDPGLRTMSPP